MLVKTEQTLCFGADEIVSSRPNFLMQGKVKTEQTLNYDTKETGLTEIVIKEEYSKWETECDSTKIKVEKCLIPFVKLKRNFEIEEVVKEAIKNGSEELGDKKNCDGNREQLMFSEFNEFQNQTEKAPQGNLLHRLSMFICAICHGCYQAKEHHFCSGTKNQTCMSQVSSLSITNEHTLECQSKIMQNVCTVCRKTFSSKSHLKRHEKNVHQGLFICETCGSHFSCKRLLSHHFKIHSSTSSNGRVCKVEVKNKNRLADRVTYPHVTFPCTFCMKSFKTKTELKSHFITHTAEKNYWCSLCKKSFGRKSALRDHLDYWHSSQDKKYQCNECSRSFKHRKNLNCHTRNIHSKRTLSCFECGDTFKNKACLRIHTQTHTGLKPYSCSVCSKKFAQPAHLKRHERVHSGAKPYVCKVCSKPFRDSSNFRVHEIYHLGLKPFKCDKCEKSYNQKSHLNTHLKTHSNERPFVCSTCGDSFKQRCVLKSHILLHSDIKPFNCENCGRSFAQVTAFKRHKCLETW